MNKQLSFPEPISLQEDAHKVAKKQLDIKYPHSIANIKGMIYLWIPSFDNP
jgi:hypothetical protein